MITFGVVVGRVVEVKPHPNADFIQLAQVDLGIGEPVQIVFGGPPNVKEGSLVAVAPPGSRLPPRWKKMRRRRYRGESSHGMLCSLGELGWDTTAPEEVALLHNVTPGASLDGVTATEWPPLVINTTSASDSVPVRDAQRLPSMAVEPATARDRYDDSSLAARQVISQASTVVHTASESDPGAAHHYGLSTQGADPTNHSSGDPGEPNGTVGTQRPATTSTCSARCPLHTQKSNSTTR